MRYERRTNGMTISERTRLVSMFTGLILLGLLIMRARDPGLWTWLVPEAPSRAVSSENQDMVSESIGNREATERLDSALTDWDAEQMTAAAEEFQAVTDGTLETQAEEMPAYWRLMTWIQNQAFDQLESRARGNRVFAEMFHRPEDYRGQLMRLDLRARRILSYDVPANALGIQRLYEIWGWTSESKAWLYVAVVPDLPPQMPLGADVDERMTLCGYFFKLQGYREAGAAPRDKPLLAPLLIGRVEWHPEAKPGLPGVGSRWSPWLLAVIALVVSGGALWSVLRVRPPARKTLRVSTKGPELRQWLDAAGPDASEFSDGGGDIATHANEADVNEPPSETWRP